MSGIGNYVAQFVTIDVKQWTLPTVDIFTEIREYLAEWEKSPIQILSAATGYKYSAKYIVEKMNFFMTDSTAHNLEVFDYVCEDLGTEHSLPQWLVICLYKWCSNEKLKKYYKIFVMVWYMLK